MSEKKMEQTAKKAESIQKLNAKIAKEEKESVIPSTQGMTKTITIKKGTKYEYTLRLRFLGVEEMSNLLDNAENPFGNNNRTAFMNAVIDEGVIEKPKITSLDWFQEHKGFLEAYNKIYSFCLDGLDGELN